MAELWPNGPLVLPHEFTVDDQAFILPAVPTPTLFGWLGHGMWWQLYPGLIDASTLLPVTLRFRDVDDDYDYEHLHDVATVLFGRLTGLAALDGSGDGWWPGQRLASTALLDWPSYAAWCAEHGHTPLGGQLYEVMGRAYAWIRDSRAKPMDRETWQNLEKLDQRVFAPPPHIAVVSEAALPRSMRDAEAAMALASLRETLPGEVVEAEFIPNSPS